MSKVKIPEGIITEQRAHLNNLKTALIKLFQAQKKQNDSSEVSLEVSPEVANLKTAAIEALKTFEKCGYTSENLGYMDNSLGDLTQAIKMLNKWSITNTKLATHHGMFVLLQKDHEKYLAVCQSESFRTVFANCSKEYSQLLTELENAFYINMCGDTLPDPHQYITDAQTAITNFLNYNKVTAVLKEVSCSTSIIYFIMSFFNKEWAENYLAEKLGESKSEQEIQKIQRFFDHKMPKEGPAEGVDPGKGVDEEFRKPDLA